MQPNTIILTSGLTGSSVLTGLIARGGYWPGKSTQQKEDYNTYENSELVRLNCQLMDAVGYTGNYMTEFSPELLKRMDSLAGTIDDSPYRRFLEACNEHSPWVWKDPRLWVTIHFWKHYLNLDQCRFVLLTRSLLQCWLSGTLRRQIRSYKDSRQYELRVQNAIRQFIRDSGAHSVEISYDDLIATPDSVLARLNASLGSRLTVEDLRSVYHKPLYKAPKTSLANTCKALLIYAKNYSERIDARPVHQGRR